MIQTIRDIRPFVGFVINLSFSGFPAFWFSVPLVLVLLAFAGCGSTEPHLPIIFSVTAEPDIVPPGQASTLTVEAGDTDRDELSYLWTVSAGSIEGSGKTVKWLSPEAEGRYQLTVTVSDGSDSVAQTVTIWVWAPRPGDYYPLEVGNTWTFRDTNDNTIDFEIIATIEIWGDTSDTTAFVKQMITSESADAVNYSYIAKDSDIVYQYAMGGSSAGGDTIIFLPELPIYKLPLIPGESWEVEFDVKLPEGFFVGSGVAVYEVVSEEDLTVEAGSFQHVFQVKEDFTWELLGQEIDHIVSHHWVAPNVGIVKFAQEETIGGETVVIEATLKSYSLK
jgi:hypothetical protein